MPKTATASIVCLSVTVAAVIINLWIPAVAGQAATDMPPWAASLQRDLHVIQEQHGTMLREISSVAQHVADLEKRLDIQRKALDDKDPSKSAERITHLEDMVQGHMREDEQQKIAAEKSRENIQSYLRIALSVLLGLFLNEGWKWWFRQKSNKKIDSLTGTVETLKTQTNSKMNQMLQMHGEAEYSRGTQDERTAQENKDKDKPIASSGTGSAA